MKMTGNQIKYQFHFYCILPAMLTFSPRKSHFSSNSLNGRELKYFWPFSDILFKKIPQLLKNPAVVGK